MAAISEMQAQAQQCQRAGDMARVEQISRQILQMDPGNLDALHLLAVSLHRLGKLTEAVEQYQKVLHINAKRADVHYGLGTVLTMQGLSEEATASFKESVQLEPANARFHN